jgi:hypothetical protein
MILDHWTAMWSWYDLRSLFEQWSRIWSEIKIKVIVPASDYWRKSQTGTHCIELFCCWVAGSSYGVYVIIPIAGRTEYSSHLSQAILIISNIFINICTANEYHNNSCTKYGPKPISNARKIENFETHLRIIPWDTLQGYILLCHATANHPLNRLSD